MCFKGIRIQTFQQKKTLSPGSFTGDFYKIFKKRSPTQNMLENSGRGNTHL